MALETPSDYTVRRFSLDVWKKFLREARPYTKDMIGLILCAIVLAVIDSMFTLMIRWVINDLQADGMTSLWPHACAYIVLAIAFASCIAVFIYLGGKISTHLGYDVRQKGFKKLQDLSFSFYDTRSVGWLVTRLTSDCDRLTRILAWGTLDIVWGGMLIVAVAVISLVLNWRLAILMLLVVPPMAVVSLYFQRRILKTSRLVRKTNSHITASHNESISGMRTTRSLVRETDNFGEFQSLTTTMYNSSVRNSLLAAMFLPIITSMCALAVAVSLWRGGAIAVGDPGRIGEMVVFINFSLILFAPIQEIASRLVDIQSCQAAAERVMDLLEIEPEIQDSPEVIRAIQQRSRNGSDDGAAADGHDTEMHTIEFRDVSFAYKSGQQVLRNFSLTARSGQTVALVGPTGGGKSTIVSLLCRFYEPTDGQILINGVDYRKRSLHWLQSSCGIVLQTPHVFSTTIGDNIRYGRLDATDEEVARAAAMVNADGFIKQMDHGYQTQVGEGGVKLSTGQKQLISLARAILADPQLFVMDEATSSVDSDTEHLIQQGLASVLGGRISFIIAHRLSTIRSADSIVVIEDGLISEQGTHHELIALKGTYYGLYTNQFRREKQDEIFKGG
ncbi:MAG: ABC transporter ATP-binding protein [Phycisphaerae bacterium]|jgi:ATP-binding cassette subfamily B protein|nr:ABC transporter ATP-binding protein [Phycisphaerae bacterium]